MSVSVSPCTRREDYVPFEAVIDDIRTETSDVKTYKVVFPNGRFDFLPGQFIMLSILGIGEAPFSIPSGPDKADYIELSIKKVGKLTDVVHSLSVGDKIGVRGPYGNFFPIQEQKGRDLLFIAGGIGLAPLRSVIEYALHRRLEYGRIEIVYGARTSGDLVYKGDFDLWRSAPDTYLHLTVDRGSSDWDGNVGVVTTLFDRVKVDPAKTTAFVCGPPVMIPFALKDLSAKGYEPENIFVTLERRMKCGVGKCLHCYLGNGLYVCKDGPVFSAQQLSQIP